MFTTIIYSFCCEAQSISLGRNTKILQNITFPFFVIAWKLSAAGKPDRNIPKDAELSAEYTLIDHDGNDSILEELKTRFL
jgi:hypothetical protein